MIWRDFMLGAWAGMLPMLTAVAFLLGREHARHAETRDKLLRLAELVYRERPEMRAAVIDIMNNTKGKCHDENSNRNDSGHVS